MDDSEHWGFDAMTHASYDNARKAVRESPLVAGERDRYEWVDKVTGLPCLIVRVLHTGTLCGYVGVPPGHPWHGRGYDDGPLAEVEVHGGLTYSAACEGRVCHTPRPGEPDNVWWLGFDCAHYGDVMPAFANDNLYNDGSVYRDVPFVENQCRRLARQVHHAR